MRARTVLVLVALAGAIGSGASAAAAPPPPARRSPIRWSTSAVSPTPPASSRASSTPSRARRARDHRDATASGPMTSPTRAPGLLDTFQPPEILGANGYWQDEDMEIDTRRKLIIGALDPRHDDVDQTSCPGIGTLGAKNRNPKLPLGLLRHLLRRPGGTCGRSATSSSCPRAIRRAASRTAATSGPAARRGATTSPTSARSRRAAAATAGRSGSPT